MGWSDIFGAGRSRSAAAVEEFSVSEEVPTRYAPDDVETIHRIEPTNWLSRLWDRPGGFALAALVGWGVVPFLVFVGIGVVRDTLVLPGPGHGVLEASVFLSYFPVSVLLIVTSHYALSNLRDTLNSLTGLARFQEDTEYLEEERFRSTLTRADLERLFRFYEYVLATYTFRGSSDEIELPRRDWTPDRGAAGAESAATVESDGGPTVESDGGGSVEPNDGGAPDGGDEPGWIGREDLRRTFLLWFRAPQAVFVLGGLAFFAIATEHHWNAVATYGFELWSSQRHLVGFGARMVYDFMLYVIMGPFVATRLLACILLMHHALTRMQRERGIRYLRFAIDEAGGFGKFGSQSLKNVFVLLPLTISIAVSIVFLPSNELTIVGVVVFLLSLPVAFFWPLLGARRSMKRMKQMELEIIADSLLDTYEGYKEQLEETDTEDPANYDVLTDQGEALERAETIFNGIKNQPTWPFSKTLIGQFLSLMTVLAGALASILSSFY